MRFERGIGVKKSLGIGMSFDNLKRGMILQITKSFSSTKWGEINNHTKAYNKFFEGRYIVIKSTPVYHQDGKIDFRIRNCYNLDTAERQSKIILSKDEDEEMKYYSCMRIEQMSRIQFNRRFKVVG